MIITDHALLRYLERVVQLDIDALRKDILPYEVQEEASKGGDGRGDWFSCRGGACPHPSPK